MPPHRIVVVGAGLAGARTCQELRSRGYGHELILLGAEPHQPYDRPPLSKALLRGALDGLDDVRVDVDLDALDVRFLRETTAQALAHGVLSTSAGVPGQVAHRGREDAMGERLCRGLPQEPHVEGVEVHVDADVVQAVERPA